MKQDHRPGQAATLLLVATACAGCAELQAFLPTVTFERLAVRDISFEDVQTDFVFRIDNPNPLEVDLASFGYALELAGVELLEGSNDGGFTLERQGSSELVLPVGIVFADALETVQATRGLDTVPFRLDGHFGFDTPAGVARVRYDEGGDFPALRTPRFEVERLRLKRLDVFGADLELDVQVDNAIGSTLFFERFRYDLQLGGQDVVTGMLDTFAVEGDDATVVSLPIAVDLLSAGVAVVDALLNDRRLDLALDASMDVDTPFGVIPLQIDETGRLRVE